MITFIGNFGIPHSILHQIIKQKLKHMELEIKNLTKQYPNGIKALDNINLSIGKGLFGLLGPTERENQH